MTIGKAMSLRINELLKERKMTQYRLEQKTGIPHGTMCGITSGQNNDIRFGTIIKIANGFDMSFSEFLNNPLFLSDELEFEY
jgi:transcriptional regulator with XRE-family HTH domain